MPAAFKKLELTDFRYEQRVKLLSDNHLKVFLLMYSLCYKGTRTKSPRRLATNRIAKSTSLSYKQVRGAIDKIVKLRLLQKYTTTFPEKHGTQTLWSSACYYRIMT